MVGKQGPGIAGGFGFGKNISQPFKKFSKIQIIPKDSAAFDPSEDDVVNGSGKSMRAFRGMALLYQNHFRE
jgi:hypothetical protein